LVHGTVAACLVAAGFRFAQLDLPGLRLDLAPPVGALVSVLFIVWMVNLYNFMDGMDGLAGGMAVAGFAALAALGHLSGDAAYAFTNAAVVAAVGGFLLWNLPPARVFMGDTGSASLGLLAALAVIGGRREGVFPLWVGLLVFSPFLFDATWTLLRRLARKQRIWEPHRTHCYQRLVTAGWGQRKTLAVAYLLIAAAAASGLLLAHAPTLLQWLGLALWALCYLTIAWLTRHLGAPESAQRSPGGAV
jgi:UDP-N-acetylmuramyl pentapeptide phosphotransferase/UDP-N-acetylglucosamine-1-phosphate transferase